MSVMQASFWPVFVKWWTLVLGKRLCFNHSWIRFLRNVASPFHILSTGLGKKHYLVFESVIWNVPTKNSPFRFCNKSWNLFHELRKDLNQNSCLQGAQMYSYIHKGRLPGRERFLWRRRGSSTIPGVRNQLILLLWTLISHHVKSSSAGANKSISPSKV